MRWLAIWPNARAFSLNQRLNAEQLPAAELPANRVLTQTWRVVSLSALSPSHSTARRARWDSRGRAHWVLTRADQCITTAPESLDFRQEPADEVPTGDR